MPNTKFGRSRERKVVFAVVVDRVLSNGEIEDIPTCSMITDMGKVSANQPQRCIGISLTTDGDLNIQEGIHSFIFNIRHPSGS